MKIDVAVFANHAVLRPDGLFSLLDGGLEWISVRELPAMCPNLALLARISFDPAECNREYEARVEVTSPTGKQMIPNLSVTLKPKLHARHPEQPTTFAAHFIYNGFVFEEAGFHRFEVKIGDTSLGLIMLEAVWEASP